MPGESAFGMILLMSDMDVTRLILVADPVTDTFEIDDDWTALFTAGVTFRVTGSTGNDATYTCDVNSTYDPPPGTERTTITTVEAVADNTADGLIEYWPSVAHITNVGGPALSLDTVDVTAHNSTGAWEEHVPTILRTGEVTLDINYNPAEVTHDATDGLPAVMKAKRLNDFEVVFPIPVVGGTTWAISAYVNKFEPGAPHDGKSSASVALEVTGEPTLA